MSAPAAVPSSLPSLSPDPHLEAAFAKRFLARGTTTQPLIARSGELHTKRCAKWDIFVGGQMCRVSQRIVRMIVVNVVDIRPEYRRQGILRQGLGLLMTRFALETRALVLELNAVHNRHLYAWALRQTNVFVSPYGPECVHIYIDFASPSFAGMDVPVELRDQSQALIARLKSEPIVARNMANSFITQALLTRVGEARVASETVETMAEYTPDDIELSRAYLSPMALMNACQPWINENCARLFGLDAAVDKEGALC